MPKLGMIFLAVVLLQLILTTRVIAQCSALDQLQKSISSLQAEADKLKQSADVATKVYLFLFIYFLCKQVSAV
jgi:cell division protein FtsB